MARQKNIFSKLGSYFVEILIIIVGVYISFALNDWQQRQSDETDYQNYLKRLQQDIRIDSLQMVNDMRLYTNKVKAVDLIYKYHEGFNRDSIALLGQAQNTLSSYVRFLPNDNTFQVLSSTGDFKVFRNDSLVSNLFQLYSYDYAFIEMIGQEVNQERVQLLKPYLIQNIYFEDEITFPIVKTNIPEVVRDRTFRNICFNYQGSSYSAVNSYQRALTRLVRINKMIREELKK